MQSWPWTQGSLKFPSCIDLKIILTGFIKLEV